MSYRISGRRDDSKTPRFVRAREIDIEVSKKRADGSDLPENQFRLIASTDVAYDWGYYTERLMHGQQNVDMSGAVSCLFNHDYNQVIGRIDSCSVDGKEMHATVEIDPEVTGSNGLKILRALKQKYIRGVSIGYDYSAKDCTISEDDSGKRNVVVNRWTLREISITPTPADLAAQVVRHRSDWAVAAFAEARAIKKEEISMNFSDWLKARNLDEKTLSKEELALLKRTFEAEAKISQGDEVATERAKREKAEKELAESKHREVMATLARSHGIEWKTEEADGKTREQCGEIMLARAAEKLQRMPAGGVGVDIVITRDAADKADAAAEDGLSELLGVVDAKSQDLGMRGGSVLDIGRRWLHARGEKEILNSNRDEIAQMLLGDSGRRYTRYQRKKGKRDAANVTSGMFTSYVLANVMDKVLYNGFMQSDEVITYPIWTDSREVMDFKTFSGGALDAGNLTETAENIAFPELSKAEGGYSSALGLWGATISLTLQAMANDDLGEFMRLLRMAGFLVRRTIDQKVYTDLAAATWTNRTTVGDLADATVSANRASMSNITGPAGVKLGITPRYLIVPSGLRAAALGVTQLAPALVMNDAIKVNTDLLPVITPFLATKTTPTQSTWYMAASKMFSALIVATLRGVNAPMVEEYDPGAVAARKWKIMFPFKVVIPTVSSNVQGMWQGTHS